MKVLYFHQHFSTPKGSIGNRSFWMSKQLIKSGHKVCIVCGRAAGSDSGLTGNFVNGSRRGFFEGIEIIELDISYSNNQRFSSRIISFIKYVLKSIYIVFSEKYDLIFATSTPLTISIPAIFAKLFLSKKFIFEVRDLWPELPKAMGVIKNPIVLKVLSILEWVSYISADHIIALSPGIEKGIKKRVPNSSKISMIPNGCDINFFNDKNTFWRPDYIDKNNFLAIYAGTHGIANGLDAVIDTAKILNERGFHNIKFLLVGDGIMKKSLKEETKRNSLKNIYFHDPLPKKQLSDLLHSSDLGMQILSNIPAFYYGTSPNKFFDYLAIGLPVINNYPGWISDIINEYHCGVAISPDNPEEFAEKLIYLSENGELLKIMKQNSFKAAKKFERTLLAEKWVQCLDEVNKSSK